MISLEESAITDILPEHLAQLPEVKALSYAITNSQKGILDTVGHSMVYAAIENLPEMIVDVLATELRAQYYERNLPIDKKREIVKNTLYLYGKLGTPEAVEKMIHIIFGEGELHEWFDTGGKPATFSLSIPGTRTEEAFARFGKMIGRTKNIRSHLEHINFEAAPRGDISAAVSQTPVTVMRQTIL